ncbi:unnamed protein product [Rhodiola kirilowii]
MKVGCAMKPSDVANIGVYCQICGSPSHYADGCLVIGADDNNSNREDANYVGQNNQGPKNPAPTGFPYKQQQGNAPYQPRGEYNNQAQQSQNNNSYQPRPQYNNQS